MTGISQAIVHDDLKLAKKLIAEGKGINQTDPYGENALIQACIIENNELVALLLASGANIDRPGITGNTALHWAVDTANVQITELLLRNGANPNSYGTSGQPPLVSARLRHHQRLVEILIEYGASIDFAKDYITAKRIGHRFELKGHAKILSPKNKYVEVNYEGFILEFSLNLIHNALFHFLDSKVLQDEYKELEGPLTKILKALNNAKHLIPPIFRDKFEAHKKQSIPLMGDELLIIPVGYQGHAICFIKYGNLFARCDRGVNKFTDTSIIYTIKNPFTFNRKFVENLIYVSHDEQYIHNDIKTILSLSPLISLPTKQQVSGNCSWANTEASIVTTLFMILYIRKQEVNEIDKTNNITKYAMNLFESWINWDKNIAIEQCINRFKNTTSDAQKASYANMLATVLFNRLDVTNPDDIERAKNILNILTLPKFKNILASYTTSYCTPQGGKQGVSFTKLLLMANLDIATLELTKTNLLKQGKKEGAFRAFLKASAIGDLKLLTTLLNDYQMINVNDMDSTGSTALMYAAWMGHMEIVEQLIENYKANINLVNDKGGSAQQYAQLSGNTDIAEYLTKIANIH
ncbi:MAG: hypothetical protein HON32_09360 [Francisellaceae bacterium]|jgi:ankyrin repeat protein|nr:hypothetical protein [Francisellaceae bacterium]MBT6539397.1 hypothetical protein [Francisellaceae bacterium]